MTKDPFLLLQFVCRSELIKDKGMHTMLKKLDKIAEWIANWIVVISGIAVCALIFTGAVMRYILHTDFYGSEELILFAAFWLYFTGSALASKHNTHIKADMLDMFIKNKSALNAANIIKYVISLGMAAVASVWAVKYVQWNININMKSNVFRFPVYITVLPIAISFIVWTIYCVRDLIVCIHGLKDGDSKSVQEGE